MDYDVCIRCNLPYEDINNLPCCEECVRLNKDQVNKLMFASQR